MCCCRLDLQLDIGGPNLGLSCGWMSEDHWHLLKQA
uniref:Uncharacterized protein n=1 Tax=Physcomitrium patens TaxID=3218 RepID=A0A2K1LBY3_PHYPA|nr:hypothetical protein PHYPA_001947 [Physcomitrium patens]